MEHEDPGLRMVNRFPFPRYIETEAFFFTAAFVVFFFFFFLWCGPPSPALGPPSASSFPTPVGGGGFPVLLPQRFGLLWPRIRVAPVFFLTPACPTSEDLAILVEESGSNVPPDILSINR